MKKFAVIFVALMAFVAVLQAETYTGLVVSKNGTAVIASESNPNQTIVNVMMSIAGEVLPYEGKVVEVTGTLHPERSFPTLQTVESIKEVSAE